eukprot:scaffold2871_cov381-Prasinococcus_capsulatus_cf.AAC.7
MLPLCERKQTAEEVTAAALDTWKQQALAKIYAIGNRFQDMDDGPSAAELKVRSFTSPKGTVAAAA